MKRKCTYHHVIQLSNALKESIKSSRKPQEFRSLQNNALVHAMPVDAIITQ